MNSCSALTLRLLILLLVSHRLLLLYVDWGLGLNHSWLSVVWIVGGHLCGFIILIFPLFVSIVFWATFRSIAFIRWIMRALWDNFFFFCIISSVLAFLVTAATNNTGRTTYNHYNSEHDPSSILSRFSFSDAFLINSCTTSIDSIRVRSVCVAWTISVPVPAHYNHTTTVASAVRARVASRWITASWRSWTTRSPSARPSTSATTTTSSSSQDATKKGCLLSSLRQHVLFPLIRLSGCHLLSVTEAEEELRY